MRSKGDRAFATAAPRLWNCLHWPLCPASHLEKTKPIISSQNPHANYQYGGGFGAWVCFAATGLGHLAILPQILVILLWGTIHFLKSLFCHFHVFVALDV